MASFRGLIGVSLVLGVLALVGLAPLGAVHPADEKDKFWVFIGTYTGNKPGEKGESAGIYRFLFDAKTGKLTDKAVAAEARDPSFLAIDPARHALYAVCEGPNEVFAYNLDARTGALKFLNAQSSGGGGPCHLSIDRTGKCVLAANYGGGSVCCLPIKADGSLAPATAFIQHKGSGPNKERQMEPHAHSINVDAGNHFAFVADLGLDKVFVYKLDPARGTLTPNDFAALQLAPGAGPRHFAFHPSGKYAYVINELDSTVSALSYDPSTGTLKVLQTLSTLPAPHQGNSTAEVVVHPSGKFLYGSNRGHNSIAVFAIDEATGKLKAVGHQNKGINIPRNFAIDPTGAYAIVASQNGNDLLVFAINPSTGDLTPTGVRAEVKKPVCVRFVPVAG